MENKQQKNPLLAQEQRKEDQEQSLRPQYLKDYLGQKSLKEKLSIFIDAAKSREDVIEHCLFYGPPGLGKTTLAYVMANELNSNIIVTSGPALEKAGDLAAILSNLQDGDILFIDEIHRLGKAVEETLYPAMEDYELSIVIGQGAGAKAIKIPLPKFVLIGATTRAGLIAAPLRDRFGFTARLNYYETEDLANIVRKSAEKLKIEATQDGAIEIARRSRGTPRIANRLLKRVRDYAQVKADGYIDKEVSNKALLMLNVDNKGLDEMDRRILEVIINNFSGGPVGLSTLAASVGEESDTIEDVYESFLIYKGFISKTPRGRVATEVAYEHMKIENPKINKDLF